MSAYFFLQRLTRVVVGFLLLLIPLAATADGSQISKQQTEQIESIIKDYLLKNPAIIREAIVNLQRQEAEAAAARSREAVKALHKEIFESAGSPSVGNRNGDITIVEFFDFHCGYCKKVAPVVHEILKSDSKVRFVFKQLPILGPDSLFAAKVALAANMQGKYAEIHDALIAAESLDEKTVLGIAGKQGLNLVQLRHDMNSEAVMEEIESNSKMSVPLGITGTPVFVVGETLVPGAIDLDNLRLMIDAERKKKQ